MTLPQAIVRLSGAMTFPGPQMILKCPGSTVGEVLDHCCQLRPELRPRIFRDDGMVWVGVFLNGRSIKQLQGLDTPVCEDDELRLTPPIAGG